MPEQAAMLAERGKNQQKAIWIRSEIIPLFQQKKPMRCNDEILSPF
ncbi:MAG TPA: hypothetical protein VJK54_10840 [Chthoniobacterales bacterium]|nr:hypothetical protein [Chthoniobacterales bacterium]